MGDDAPQHTGFRRRCGASGIGEPLVTVVPLLLLEAMGNRKTQLRVAGSGRRQRVFSGDFKFWGISGQKMLHVICISQAGESWEIWVPVIPTGAGGGQQGLEHTFHCRANEPLGSVLLIATAILSSGAFPAKKCYM